MTHRQLLRLILPACIAAAALAVPASASAILVGMESNRELVNTTQTPELQAKALDLMKEQGVQVVRANARWNEIAAGCAGQSAAALEDHTNACYSWARTDSLATLANARGMQVLLSFQQNPLWLHPGKVNADSETQYYMGNTVAEFNRTKQFLYAFHKAAATRYKAGSSFGTVKFWTVHNEPNSRYYWGGPPNPDRYAQLYGSVARAIRLGNPSAKIAPGPTGPVGGAGGMKPVPFIRGFQAAVVKYLPGSMATKRSYINAWAHNPYPDTKNGPSYVSRRQQADWITMGSIDKLFRLLDSKPISRNTKVWATEFGWQTPPERADGTTAANQARFVAEAFDYLDSKRIGTQGRVEIGISYGLSDPEDLADWQSGTLTNAGVKKPSFYMFQRMISVPQAALNGRVAPNTRVRIWGRSNVNPSGTQLAWRLVGGKCDSRAPMNGFCTLKGQRGVMGTPGAKYAFLTVRRGQRIDFAVYDTVSKTYGRTQRITVR